MSPCDAFEQEGDEPIDLCDSDDDALPQQPADSHVPSHKGQAAAKDAEAKRQKGEAATQPYSLAPPASEASNRKVPDMAKYSSSAAAQGLKASRRKAAVPAEQAQRTETRQLGIRDPLPPQLTGSNALLKSLAQGANRVSQPS